MRNYTADYHLVYGLKQLLVKWNNNWCSCLKQVSLLVYSKVLEFYTFHVNIYNLQFKVINFNYSAALKCLDFLNVICLQHKNK